MLANSEKWDLAKAIEFQSHLQSPDCRPGAVKVLHYLSLSNSDFPLPYLLPLVVYEMTSVYSA